MHNLLLKIIYDFYALHQALRIRKKLVIDTFL